MPGKGDELLTEQQVAELLKVSRSTVRSWRSAGTGPPVVYAGRFPRYWRSTVESWLTERQGKASLKGVANMRFSEFENASLEFWNARLQQISIAQRQGRIDPPDARLLYPTLLLSTETRRFFIMELIGSAPDYRVLSAKRHREPEIERYFGQFSFPTARLAGSEPAFVFEGREASLRAIGLRNKGAEARLSERFPYVNGLHGTWLVSESESRVLVIFDPESNYSCLEDCTIVNNLEGVVRIKRINVLLVIAKETSTYDYSEYLGRQFGGPELHGVHVVMPGAAEKHSVAADFASTFLFPGLRETTLGEFFQTHPELIEKAFCSPSFIYEPYLEWQEGTAEKGEKAINPDLLIEGRDGLFDIYDLKLPLLDKASIAKGGRPRRRFIATVSEGIAQLAHYDEYFSHDANRAYALNKYGIKVDNPILGLIVGNEENINRQHVEEAKRSLRSSFEVIDYDTLLRLYLHSNC